MIIKSTGRGGRPRPVTEQVIPGPSPLDRVGAQEGRAAWETLVAQVADHRRNIEVIAEIARRHRPKTSGTVGAAESLAKKGRIVDLPFRAHLRLCRHFGSHLVLRGDLLRRERP